MYAVYSNTRNSALPFTSEILTHFLYIKPIWLAASRLLTTLDPSNNLQIYYIGHIKELYLRKINVHKFLLLLPYTQMEYTISHNW